MMIHLTLSQFSSFSSFLGDRGGDRGCSSFGVTLFGIGIPDFLDLSISSEVCKQKVMTMNNHRFRSTKNFSVKLKTFSYPLFLAYVLGAQKNRLVETVLLSIHDICFG